MISSFYDSILPDEALNGYCFMQHEVLYADQFTGNVAGQDLLCSPMCIEDVFAHYHPCIKHIGIATDEGKLVYEDFAFLHISDFNDRELIAQSKTLSALCDRQYDSVLAEQWLKQNLRVVHEEIRTIEIAYRTLSLFFDNALSMQQGQLTIINVSKEELSICDSAGTMAIRKELERHYDSLSWRRGYGMLIVPGYLGNTITVKMWAKIAWQSHTLLVTDFKDCIDFNTLIRELGDAHVCNQDAYMASVVMACNYVAAEPRSVIDKDREAMYLPSSAALAGMIYEMWQSLLNPTIQEEQQGSEEHVVKNTFEAIGCCVCVPRISLSEQEAEMLVDEGSVPILHGKTAILRTLYDGPTVGLKDVQLTLALNFVHIVLKRIIEQECICNWTKRTQHEVTKIIMDFLEIHKGSGKLIEEWGQMQVGQDPRTKITSVDVLIKFSFASRPFLLKVTQDSITMTD